MRETRFYWKLRKGVRSEMLWIDGDGCPREIKDILYKSAMKRGYPLTLVVNRLQHIPKSQNISIHVVPAGPDEADRFIVESVCPGDLVITGDIPCAAEALEKGAEVITPHGDVLTSENIRERLSMRDFFEQLRAAGQHSSGGASFSARDKHNFASALDRALSRILKERG